MLAGLILVGGYLVYTNLFSSDSGGSSSASARPVTQAPQISAPSASDTARINARRNRNQRPTEWNVPYRTAGVVIDPVKVDPTLRLDLLAKVQQVEVSAAQRNLFQFGEIVKPPQPTTPLPNPGHINIRGPQPAPVIAGGPPPKPTAPPIALKYYGYSSPRATNRKRAFFLDGEDIIVASEGELIKRRYRLVKIGVNSVTVEDTQFNSEQTLPLAADLG